MNRRDFMKSAAAGVLLANTHDIPQPRAALDRSADLVLRGGKVATVNRAFSFAEAAAVRDDRIVFVGKNAEAKGFIGPGTRVIELGGKLVVPGLIDAHAHLKGFALSLLRLDLRGTVSFEEIAAKVAAEARKRAPGEWILGDAWDQNDWETKEMPTHGALDRAAPRNPVWLVRVDGHAGIANRTALERCGVTSRTANPDGGEILRSADGSPTGVFVDNAMSLITRHIPESSPERVADALAAASDACLAAGLTCVHDAGVSPGAIALYRRLIDNGRLGIRVYAMLGDPGDGDAAVYLAANRVSGYGSHRLEVRSVKLFMDGALGSRGAALFEPYTDRPGYTGLLTTTPEHILNISRAALATGFQVCTHAIGDRANRLVLDAYERAFRERSGVDRRFRIEHAQVVSLADIPRFASLGVIPSMQPTHATSDMPWAEARLGPDRVKGAYAWRKFLDSGSIIPCGSDFPVEERQPMLGIYAAITREDLSGKPPGGWRPEERMTREEALRGFTVWAAYAAFQDSILGSIEPGKLADMVVLSRDILAIEPHEIPTTVPEYTIVGGKVRYERGTRQSK
jgi:hypothetical protein